MPKAFSPKSYWSILSSDIPFQFFQDPNTHHDSDHRLICTRSQLPLFASCRSSPLFYQNMLTPITPHPGNVDDTNAGTSASGFNAAVTAATGHYGLGPSQPAHSYPYTAAGVPFNSYYGGLEYYSNYAPQQHQTFPPHSMTPVGAASQLHPQQMPPQHPQHQSPYLGYHVAGSISASTHNTSPSGSYYSSASNGRDRDYAAYELVSNADCDVEQFKNSAGKYQCPTCGKAYKYFKHLKRHNVKHSGDRPHVCKLCGDSFCRSDIMRRHEKRCMLKLKTTGTCSVISRVPKKLIPEYRIIPELPHLTINNSERRQRIRNIKRLDSSGYPGGMTGLMIKHPESPESPTTLLHANKYPENDSNGSDDGKLSPSYKLSPTAFPSYTSRPLSYNSLAALPASQVLTPPPSSDSPVQMMSYNHYSQLNASQAAAAAATVGALHWPMQMSQPYPGSYAEVKPDQV